MHVYSQYGERLREQRDALGLSQQAVADSCGVSLRSQQNYEKGERSPDAAYLAALAGIGADVMYVLTGQRNGPPPTSLSRRAAALLDNYQHTDDEGQKMLESMANMAAQSKARKA